MGKRVDAACSWRGWSGTGGNAGERTVVGEGLERERGADKPGVARNCLRVRLVPGRCQDASVASRAATADPLSMCQVRTAEALRARCEPFPCLRTTFFSACACAGSAVATLSKEEVRSLAAGERSQPTVAVLYAPWCPFCQVGSGYCGRRVQVPAGG